MPGKCIFQEHWFNLECGKDWKLWLRPVNGDKLKAHCTVCKTNFDVACSGVGSVKSHEKGIRHSKLINALVSGKQSTLNFKSSVLVATEQPAPCAASSTSKSGIPVATVQTAGSSNSPLCAPERLSKDVHEHITSVNKLSNFLIKDDVTKAEIVWALNKVMSHSSSRSGGNATDLFKLMFHDSIIAQNFKMHKDKLSYIITYGLGPFFQNLLVDQVKKCDFFAISFDESLNKVAQKCQMDLVVRFWDNQSNTVATRYLTSEFPSRGTANDLLDSFVRGVSGMGLSITNIMQVAMDGPNVNIKLLRDLKGLLKTEAEDPDQPEMFDTGTCSLHVVNGAYKTAHNKTGWLIHEFLRSLFYLFKDYPSRRADFIHFSGSLKFPLKFCAIRWLENSQVIKRALEIIVPLRKYVDAVQNKPPLTKNFEKVKQCLNDKLLIAKLEFLQSVALELEPFLTRFQSNDALLPFMYRELYLLLHSIANRFICKRVMSEVNNSTKLMNIDLSNPANYKTVRDIDVGFGATSSCKGLKELEVLSFRNQCKMYLETLFKKLIEKCPLKSKIVKGATCLSPDVMTSQSLRVSRVTMALEEFVCKKQMTPCVADCVKRDYLQLCESRSVKEALQQFDSRTGKLDAFFSSILHDANTTNASTIKFIHQLLVMFHGNAAVERGFSINKECLVENLTEVSLVAQRAVYGAVISDIQITKSMILAVRSSSSKRQEAIKAKKNKEDEEANQQKKAAQELKLLELKKKRLIQQSNEEVDALNSEIAALNKKMRK